MTRFLVHNTLHEEYGIWILLVSQIGCYLYCSSPTFPRCKYASCRDWKDKQTCREMVLNEQRECSLLEPWLATHQTRCVTQFWCFRGSRQIGYVYHADSSLLPRMKSSECSTCVSIFATAES
ncbi:unnamed protein product [Periconia digitata]|uniref:Uncharacterized protein n=1 Tax=Periconia digitata TaxID=1303443 RepID=A0A9W4XVD9_9PLEO|nr:unnamed protein product [Periconia digitata]